MDISKNKLDGLWEDIGNLEKQTLKTLDQNKPFTIERVEKDHVVIHVHSTNKSRIIQRMEIEEAAEYLIRQGVIRRNKIREKFSEANPAYVFAILSELPGVASSIKPITLYFSKSF